MPICRVKTEEDFIAALEFISDRECFFCSLSEKILNREDCIYSIRSEDKTMGIFFYSRGQVFSGCIPTITKEIKKELETFFREHPVFCAFGEGPTVSRIEKIIAQVQPVQEKNCRKMHLMEFSDDGPKDSPVCSIKKCAVRDINSLSELHLNFVSEEVLPPWGKLSSPSEILSFEGILRSRYVIAAEKDGIFVSKIHSNAEGSSFVQLGGVYTRKEYRRMGFAALLSAYAGTHFRKQGKRTVLFVKKENSPAVHAYMNAGYRIVGEYRMVYFRPEG